MTEIAKLEFQLAGRKIEFSMALDMNSIVDKELLHVLRVAGGPEPEVVDAMARIVKPGSYVIDGGANIGFFTVLLSKLVGPEGRVLAVEPGPNNYFKLAENVKVNYATNIEIIQHPLWNEVAMVDLHMCAEGSKNSLAAHAGTRGAARLETVTLDNIVHDDFAKRGHCSVRLIKLDIEGAEEMALRGAIDLLKSKFAPYIIVELNAEALPKFDSSAEKVCDFLHGYGYSPFLLHFNGALPTLIPRGTKVNPNRLNWNVLFATIDMVAEAWPEISL